MDSPITMTAMYAVVVLLHVLGAFAFVMAHGVSMLIAIGSAARGTSCARRTSWSYPA